MESQISILDLLRWLVAVSVMAVGWFFGTVVMSAVDQSAKNAQSIAVIEERIESRIIPGIDRNHRDIEKNAEKYQQIIDVLGSWKGVPSRSSNSADSWIFSSGGEPGYGFSRSGTLFNLDRRSSLLYMGGSHSQADMLSSRIDSGSGFTFDRCLLSADRGRVGQQSFGTN